MKSPVLAPWLARLSLTVLVSACSSSLPPSADAPLEPTGEDTSLAIQTPVFTAHYVSFPALGTPAPLQVAGVLRLPRGAAGRVPAVVIAHGSGGVDSRGSFYAQALNAAGLATLELDMWSARGLAGGSEGRPRAVSETLPDAYGALKFLSAHPAIEPSRIGIMGFSWGGEMSMLTATRQAATGAAPGQRFAAHAPLYPVCWVYNRVPGYTFGDLTGAPVLLQAGTADVYDAPDSCQTLLDSLAPSDRASVSLRMYEGATHGWDRLEPALQVTDSYAHQGRGGPVDLVPSPESAGASRRAVVDFFQRTLAAP